MQTDAETETAVTHRHRDGHRRSPAPPSRSNRTSLPVGLFHSGVTTTTIWAQRSCQVPSFACKGIKDQQNRSYRSQDTMRQDAVRGGGSQTRVHPARDTGQSTGQRDR